MTTPLLVDGKPVSLGERIGKGGEGEVFALRDSADLALKLFTGGNAAPREAKVVAMIRAGLAQSTALVAYPRAIVRKEGGQFAGFLMRKITGHKPLFDLYAPAARRAAFPKADYRFLVAAAANVARAVATVHRSGCVIGDINHSGILIAGDARAALIDADSFQVSADGKQYPCLVGVPEYTPPEILGLKLSTVIRTPNHDCFGLAVVVFQLLFMGRHPFAGSYVKGEMPIEKAIKEFRFAYSQRRSVGMKPPPGASSLPDVPPAVRDAFEAAFAPETAERRPTAENWVALLEQLSATLRVCAVNNRHHYSASASECPWCRMERALGGVLLFLPPELIFHAGTAPTFDPSESGFNLAVVWAAIEAVRAPALPPAPVLPQNNVKPSAEVHAAKRAKLKRRIGGFALAAAGLAIVAAAPGYWVAWGGMIAWGLYLAFGQIQADGAFVRRYVDATQGLERAYHAWRANVAATEFGRQYAKRASVVRIARHLPPGPLVNCEQLLAFCEPRGTTAPPCPRQILIVREFNAYHHGAAGAAVC